MEGQNHSTAANASRGRVMIFDDESQMCRILVKTLQLSGFEAEAFTDPREGVEAIDRFQPDTLLTDMRMPGMSGFEVLAHVRDNHPELPVVVVTAFGTVETAVDAMLAGAFNFITKPFQQSNLLVQLERAVQFKRMVQENARLSEQLGERETPREIIGLSPAIEKVRDLIARSAPTGASVLVTGPSGSGKELVARAIHRQSPRNRRKFVAINCPSIPASLIESEMFGHERGAFTGAEQSKMGLIELSDGGTLFLDEIAELPQEIQVKLLRVLQEREIQRVGGLKQISVDLRIVAATNRILPEEMALGRFREDLFFRLNVIQIDIPPLKTRKEDIPLLAEHFIGQLRRRLNLHELSLSQDALASLMEYDWPGNVRELENILERAAVMSDSPAIDASSLSLSFGEHPGAGSTQASAKGTGATAQAEAMPTLYKEARDAFETRYLRFLLEEAGGNMTEAAKRSGISRRNLYDKIEKLGLSGELLPRR